MADKLIPDGVYVFFHETELVEFVKRADHRKRIDDLLECNNRLLQRARDAEAEIERLKNEK